MSEPRWGLPLQGSAVFQWYSIVIGCTGTPGMNAPCLKVMSAVPLVQVLSGKMTMVGHSGWLGFASLSTVWRALLQIISFCCLRKRNRMDTAPGHGGGTLATYDGRGEWGEWKEEKGGGRTFASLALSLFALSTMMVCPALMMSLPKGILVTSFLAMNMNLLQAYMMKMSMKLVWLATQMGALSRGAGVPLISIV